MQVTDLERNMGQGVNEYTTGIIPYRCICTFAHGMMFS